jgi:DNA-binding beta-propeller fold protein YncE
MSQLRNLRKVIAVWSALFVGLLAVCAVCFPSSAAANQNGSQPEALATATGKVITPAAAAGSVFEELNPGLAAAPDRRATYGAAAAVSPDGRRLAVLTSGFPAYFDSAGKLIPEASVEYVFIFDITAKAARQVQVLSVPNSFQGLAWSPGSDRIFASGGKDDTVVEFIRDGDRYVPGRTIHLGHKACLGTKPDAYCGPEAGGVAVSPDGARLLVTNLQNDSVSLIDTATGKILTEQGLRPGVIDRSYQGEPGGSYPRAVVWTSAHHAYVASARDREVMSLAMTHDKIRVVRRLPIQGQPAAVLANRSGSRLYVAVDTSSHLEIFDTAKDARLETVDTVAPANLFDNKKMLGGANSNALALTPDERTLLVCNGGQNSVAVVQLSGRAMGVAPKASSKERSEDQEEEENEHSTTVGLVPTGWYPTGVAVSKDGSMWYIVNGKSPMGPNSAWCQTSGSKYCDPKVTAQTLQERYSRNGIPELLAKNAHVNQLEHAGLLSMRAPGGLELAWLTKQVARNNHLDHPGKTEADEQLFATLRQHIKHVIYIMKENRSYDQILGDLEVGNGDPRLTLFPNSISPNHHAIARNFVTLDNLLVSGEGSIQGRDWTFAAQTNDMLERTDPLSLTTYYKGETGGIPYATDRDALTAFSTSKERHAVDPAQTADPDILPGTNYLDAVDGPGGEAGTGYLWSAALRSKLSLRNYGVNWGSQCQTWPVKDRRAASLPDVQATWWELKPYTDPYYQRCWDGVPEFWRYHEWKREFDEYVAKNSLPGLTLLWMPGDHLGSFDKALDGVNTPDTQLADNDYAVGLLIEAVANSPFAKDTIVITIEDDSSDGPDHVDAQRSIALFAGAYVRRHAVVSTRYTTVNVVKTIEEVLGIGPIGLNDALAAPMSDVFDANSAGWSYKAIVPDVLRSTKLPLPPADHAYHAVPRGSVKYWTRAMAGQDFSAVDRENPATFNRALWRGLKGDAPYPALAAGVKVRTRGRSSRAHAQSVAEAPRSQK